MDGYALSSDQCSTHSAEHLARSHPNFSMSASVRCVRVVLRLVAGARGRGRLHVARPGRPTGALAGRSDHLERFTPGGGG
jgi:hypothetical protein